MTVVLLAAATFVSTLGGGLVGLRAKDRRHLVFGLTAGVMLGVVAFDLLPEVFRLGGTSGRVPGVMLAFAAGFLVLHVVERAVAVHRAHEGEYGDHHHPQVGLLSAAALSMHSLIDGLSIGLAAQVDTKTLVLVSVAVLGHDFADGLNTVSIMLAHRNSRRRAATMLVIDAVAPVVGALLTLLVTIPDGLLAIYLGFFAGFLLYLATADILPEAHSKHPSQLTLAFTLVGVAGMYGVVTLAGA